MDEKDLLGKLDKQALIEMLMASKQTNSQLQQSLDQLSKTVDLLTGEVAALRQNRFGRSSEKNVMLLHSTVSCTSRSMRRKERSRSWSP